MSHSDYLTNYQSDLQRAQKAPLLIELSHADMATLSPKLPLDQQQLVPSLVAQSVFNRDLSGQATNVLIIDGDVIGSKSAFALLDAILEQLRHELKNIKNLATLKESLKAAAAVATGGALNDLLSEHLDKGLDFIFDEIGGQLSSLLTDVVINNIDASERILTGLEDLLSDTAGDNLGDLLNRLSKQNLSLSTAAKSELNQLSNRFSNSERIDVFQMTFKLLLAIALDEPKLIYINNPHKLDDNSLGLLSLLFSFAKNQKDNDKHIGLSVVYGYTDQLFDLYDEVEPALKGKQRLLADQRRFVQRYAMLERPSSDIPTVAIKSSLFIGRNEELTTLSERFTQRVPTTFSVISGEPGIGKTALVNQHINAIKEHHGAIVLTLLNEVGHRSNNTGLSSLEKSIIDEEKRLHLLTNWKEKGLSFVKNIGTKENVFKAAGVLFSGADKVLNIADTGYQRLQIDDNLDGLKQRGSGDLNHKQGDEKERQFNNLDKAIDALTNISSASLPIVLFIDDLQWIDDTASEYILTRLLQQPDVYIIATMRPSDAATQCKAWQPHIDSHRHSLALLSAAEVKGSTELLNESNRHKALDFEALNSKALILTGFDKNVLTQLITKVIVGEPQQHAELANAIIFALSDGESEQVNTLFAVETINMLCDAKLYNANAFERLILSEPLRFNPKIDNLTETLKATFTSLQQKYQQSLTHASQTGANQSFNLMAYAVLEERLHLLNIYFGERGNAAVNTLLFSSLLGAPFSSDLVKKVIQAVASTEITELQPLKAHLTGHSHHTHLQAEHYTIIDEVYEILRRLNTHDEKYQYRHGLLHIFLDKQLDYLLDLTFVEDNIIQKNEFIELIISVVRKQIESMSFYKKPIEVLNSEQVDIQIHHESVLASVIAKGFNLNPMRWIDEHCIILNTLARSQKKNNQIDKAIKLEETSLSILRPFIYHDLEHELENIPDEWVNNYTATLSNLASSYMSKNQSDKAIRCEEESLIITEYFYNKDKSKWVDRYFTCVNNLGCSYRDCNKLNKAIELNKLALFISETKFAEETDEWAKSYNASLINLAQTLSQSNQLERAIELQEHSLKLCKIYYDEDKDSWAASYATSLSDMSIYYCNDKRLSLAIKLQIESLAIREQYFEVTPEVWVEDYTTSLNNLAYLYNEDGQANKAIQLNNDALKILENYFGQASDEWIEDYTTSLNNLANSYCNSNQFIKAIELQNKSVQLLEFNFIKNKSHWAKNYTIQLNNLATIYKDSGEAEKALMTAEKSCNISRLFAKQNSNWENRYTSSLNEIGSLLIQLHKFKLANEYFRQYFNLFDVDNINPVNQIIQFIYPFIKYVQAVRHSTNTEFIEFETMVNDFTSSMMSKFGLDYLEMLENEKQGYWELAESTDPVDREKYQIFMQYFGSINDLHIES